MNEFISDTLVDQTEEIGRLKGCLDNVLKTVNHKHIAPSLLERMKKLTK